MNEQRFEELIRKRDGVGLSDGEADELGRMIAEREGKPYHNADDIHPDGPQANGKVTPAEAEEATEREEAGEEATPEPPIEEMDEDREEGLEKRGGQRYF
jgi:hypothetical protein